MNEVWSQGLSPTSDPRSTFFHTKFCHNTSQTRRYSPRISLFRFLTLAINQLILTKDTIVLISFIRHGLSVATLTFPQHVRSDQHDKKNLRPLWIGLAL